MLESGGDGGDRSRGTILDNLQLNTVRARMVPSESYGGLLEYPWSSLATAYAVAPKAREPWMAVTEGLALFQCEDRAADRRHFVERLEERVKAEAAETCGLSEIEGQTLQSTLRKGWYWGSE